MSSKKNAFNKVPGYYQMKAHLEKKYPGAWKEGYHNFTCGNLKVYYRADFKEWRITSFGSSLDLDAIDYPFTERSWSVLHFNASKHYVSG